MKRSHTLLKSGFNFLAPIFCLFMMMQTAFAQQTITGKVTNASNGNPLIGVTVQVKGKVIGTTTSSDGNFSVTINDVPPFTLIFSSIGFSAQEIVVENAATPLNIQLQEQTIFTDEIVVSASRVEESVLKSPVSIEKMGVMGIRSTAQPSFYDALQNLKGVEMTTQSVTFRSIRQHPWLWRQWQYPSGPDGGRYGQSGTWPQLSGRKRSWYV